ncbi:MAG TPA: hypothetical protein PK926_12855 [Spirochaetota bacterium]|nr:hypothetical protein [Spirochaetota bacterium]HPI89929.1 hypothetical protein [Spirochaetota bacterium]HPR49051.1 hypothetical protein [Spirochaetota bacterium]
MLREINGVRQKDENRIRRWFEDDYFDLIVWYDAHRNFVGFQLCYDRFGKEHALTWHKNRGFTHDKVSTGFDEFHTLATPVLVSDGPFPYDDICARFRKSSSDMDQDVAGLVLDKLEEYAGKRSA